MRLGRLALSRSGDKGDISNVSLIARDIRHYAVLERHVTADRVRAHFGPVVQGAVTRYELPALGALNFVLHGALGGGVTRSLALDAHGKSLSSLLLELDIPDAVLEDRGSHETVSSAAPLPPDRERSDR